MHLQGLCIWEPGAAKYVETIADWIGGLAHGQELWSERAKDPFRNIFVSLAHLDDGV